VSNRVKPSFVTFDTLGTLTLRTERQSSQGDKSYKWWLNPVWHRIL